MADRVLSTHTRAQRQRVGRNEKRELATDKDLGHKRVKTPKYGLGYLRDENKVTETGRAREKDRAEEGN